MASIWINSFSFVSSRPVYQANVLRSWFYMTSHGQYKRRHTTAIFADLRTIVRSASKPVSIVIVHQPCSLLQIHLRRITFKAQFAIFKKPSKLIPTISTSGITVSETIEAFRRSITHPDTYAVFIRRSPCHRHPTHPVAEIDGHPPPRGDLWTPTTVAWWS